MLYVAVAPSASDDTLYVLPVLWVTSCFRMMGPVGQNQRPVDDIMFGLNSPGGGTSQWLRRTHRRHRGQSLLFTIAMFETENQHNNDTSVGAEATSCVKILRMSGSETLGIG